MDTISHHAHKHPLTRCYFYDDSHWCHLCGVIVNGEAYYCKTGCENYIGFAIHEECAKLEEEVRHPFHAHALSLRRPTGTRRCSICKSIPHIYIYWCADCEYVLDCRCVLLSPAARNQTLDFNSDSLISCQGAKHYPYTCNICEQRIEGTLYIDPKNGNFLHQWCSNLPKEIKHPFHLSHNLSLVKVDIHAEETFKCNACGRKSSTCFGCLQCRFYLDTICAFLVPKDEKTFESSHEHPLIQCDQSSDVPIRCSGCRKPCLDSVYVCIKCGFIVDQSCAALPQQLEHPFDRRHNLILQSLTSDFECDLCQIVESGFRYVCLYCPLQIGVNCAWPISFAIDSELHHHPLVFFEKPIKAVHCSVCNQEFYTPFFLCFQCKYYLHIHCFPNLPSTVKHELHRHPLAFTNLPVKDYPEEDEDAELYCNICEERRKLVDPTYYCADCHFVAHVHCLTSQILSSYLGTGEKKSTDEAETSIENAIKDTKAIADGESFFNEVKSEIERIEMEIYEEATKLEALLERRDEKVKRASLIASILDLQYITEYKPPRLEYVKLSGRSLAHNVEFFIF